MMKLGTTLFVIAYTLCSSVYGAYAQKPLDTPVPHVHQQNHLHANDSLARHTTHQHTHDHSAPHTHARDLQHVHVHDHGDVHTHNEWSVGAFGAYAMHDASFNSLPPVENCCTGFEAKEGTGFGVQLAYTLPLSDDGWFISPRLGYVTLPVEFESFSTEIAYTGGVTSGTALFRHTLDVTWTTLIAGVTAEYALGKSAWLGMGMEGMFIATADYRQTETLEQPTNLVFESGTRVRLDRNGYLRDFSTMVFNATGSLRLRLIPRQRSAGLDAFVRYSHPLMPVFSPQTWDGMGGNPPRAFFIERYRMPIITAGLALVL